MCHVSQRESEKNFVLSEMLRGILREDLTETSIQGNSSEKNAIPRETVSSPDAEGVRVPKPTGSTPAGVWMLKAGDSVLYQMRWFT